MKISPPFPWLFRWTFWRIFLLVIASGVTLLALLDAEETWRGKQAWENYQRELKAQGVDLNFADYIPPRVPDDQNFAMTPFLAPMFEFISGTQHQKDTNAMARIYKLRLSNETSHIVDNENWAAGHALNLASVAGSFDTKKKLEIKNRDEAARYVLQEIAFTEPVIDELRAASSRPYCRFNIDYDWKPEFEIVLPHLAVVKEICEYLDMRACAELAQGQSDAAAADIHLSFRLIDSIRSEPFMISQMVRAASLTLTLQPIWEGTQSHQFSAGELEGIKRDLAALNFGEDALRTTVAERAMDQQMFTELREMPYWARMRTINQLGGNDLAGIIPRCWLYLEDLNFDRIMGTALNGISQTNRVDPEAISRNTDTVERDLGVKGWPLLWHHRVFAALFTPSIGSYELKMCRAADYARMGLMACALEQYRSAQGKYPQALDDLRGIPAVPRDIILGQPFIYRSKAGDSDYTLYSVGWNELDDHGAYPKHKSAERDGDWVWKP